MEHTITQNSALFLAHRARAAVGLNWVRMPVRSTRVQRRRPAIAAKARDGDPSSSQREFSPARYATLLFLAAASVGFAVPVLVIIT